MLRALGQAEPPRSVATVEDMALPVMLQHLGDIAQSLDLPRVTGPLRRLADHDGPNGILTRTLSTFLAVGSVADDAALRLRVHVNTLRYRLRRIREVSGLDFEDADQMLLAQLQLRLNEVVSQPLV